MSSSFPQLSLILGGVSSGKSAFAENLVRASGLKKTYLATAKALDQDMIAKVERHKVQRGEGWETIEAPLDVLTPLCDSTGIVLLDCATMLLTNHLMDGLELNVEKLIETAQTSKAKVVIVSNELGLSGIAENKMARDFQRVQGQLNQKIAKHSDFAALIVAGQAVVLRGQMPMGNS